MNRVFAVLAVVSLSACASSPPQVDRLSQSDQMARAPITIINVPPASAPVINNVISGPAYPPQQQYQQQPIYQAPAVVQPRVYVPEGYIEDYTATYNRPSRGITPSGSVYGPVQQSNWW